MIKSQNEGVNHYQSDFQRKGLKAIPTGVKVIYIFYYIGAVVGLLTGLLMSGMLGAFLGGAIGIIFAVVIIFSSIVSFIIARGLQKGKNWARILAIIFSALAFFSTLGEAIFGSASLLASLISLIISGTIAGYLTFSKKVKEAFKE